MANVWYAFQACGFTSWLMLFVSLLATPFSLLAIALAVARTRIAKLLAVLALVLGLLPVAVGAAGMTIGRSKVDAALDSHLLDPGLRERIRNEGYEEAALCLRVGLGSAAFPFLAALVAVGLALTLAPRRAER
jgi:hypothetical protein